jgi:hypothetical protein
LFPPLPCLEHGAEFGAAERRAMMYGAIALTVCSVLVCHLLMRTELRAIAATLLALVAWLLFDNGLQALVAGEA